MLQTIFILNLLLDLFFKSNYSLYELYKNRVALASTLAGQGDPGDLRWPGLRSQAYHNIVIIILLLQFL
jgi:hypothetical protein